MLIFIIGTTIGHRANLSGRFWDIGTGNTDHDRFVDLFLPETLFSRLLKTTY